MTHMGLPGYLATLTDQAENDFVYSMGNPQWHWVGGFQNLNSPTYSEPSGGWEWVTGEAWVYENWHPGEPNNKDMRYLVKTHIPPNRAGPRKDAGLP